jgi:hypothetical protein
VSSVQEGTVAITGVVKFVRPTPDYLHAYT